ncbi:hypothetical protein BOTBODRAFT_434350 [Botryobasidium botryosum FD-172 SS1]|uniref:SPX domain-containing protein n=1 Tax=Botryobasidium botryosum (strain FD-172 SS1) TaxID=930990 RepID=A0A067N586_BOTB1|nr:hypothetical protein BOTBODRAFT_434350 [Botryobasidium botryosum FD-172 SS1]
MKFSNSLKFNAVADWWDDYISYSALKKRIYELSQQQHEQLIKTSQDDPERAALIEADRTTTDDVFAALLDGELDKICAFYEAQEKELNKELEELVRQVERKEAEGLYPDAPFEDYEDSEDDEAYSDGMTSPTSTRRRSTSRRRPLGAGGELSSTKPDTPTVGQQQHSRRLSNADQEFDLEASLISLDVPPVSRAGGSMSRQQSRARAQGNSIEPVSAPRPKIPQALRIVTTDPNPPAQETIWTSKSNYAWDIRMLFKRKITTQYIAFTSLKSYVELNYSGFRKILKKYDKVIESQLKDRYLHGKVENAHPFTRATKKRINDTINNIVALYAKCITNDDITTAQKHLRIHQREQVVWERDTVWRQMIGQERRGEGNGDMKALQESTEESHVALPTPVGRFRITRRKMTLIAAIIVFIILLNTPTIEREETNRCFAILVFATILWATEAIPLFVTSMMIPMLVVCLRVIIVKDKRLNTKAATKFIFSVMFSPTIMLLIGGFTIASALSKTNIDRVIVTRVLSMSGTRPSVVLLAFMGVACFASMWISNVAAPTLCYTLIKPILRSLPPGSKFAPCLILGIALAANIGGQSSPISSPQNLIAIEAMKPRLDWAEWFTVAIPVSATSIFLIWLLLLASYRPGKTIDGQDLVLRPIRPTREPFTVKQYWVCFVCIVTIGLWCVEHAIEEYVGDMGVIAIIPIVAFFSTSVLKKADFDQFLWTVVFLAMGGIALGKAVSQSGLLETMDIVIRNLVGGLDLYEVVLSLSLIVLVVSTFISHTIASVLLVPIAAEVGKNLPGGHARLLIFITGLVCSTGMGMPVSGFPNQTAATQEDDMGQRYLSNMDFLKNGVPASIIATVVVSTVGYGLMKMIGL